VNASSRHTACLCEPPGTDRIAKTGSLKASETKRIASPTLNSGTGRFRKSGPAGEAVRQTISNYSLPPDVMRNPWPALRIASIFTVPISERRRKCSSRLSVVPLGSVDGAPACADGTEIFASHATVTTDLIAVAGNGKHIEGIETPD